ncbi:MAG: cache domain-containing protein [Pseudomonadota bacterium]|nr:cache domain-containing protein [Pseudomonadota bacterium]
MEDALQQELLKEISKIRFGDQKNGYIFVVSYEGMMLMHDVKRHLVGKNIWEITDPNGVKIVQEERKAVRNPKGDFISYVWDKPSAQKSSLNVTFQKPSGKAYPAPLPGRHRI